MDAQDGQDDLQRKRRSVCAHGDYLTLRSDSRSSASDVPDIAESLKIIPPASPSAVR
jgi:hypothetical protein